MDGFLGEYEHLTSREVEVLELVAMGLSAKEIAIRLDIAACTVARHVENVRLKTRTRNRTHMIAHVLSRGLIHLQVEAPADDEAGGI
ncbi:response regulator transcription factor [Novosphingobium sp. BL-52-GroH]|uniref:response regulator transcription factor n=1 Tax=Novosphingobium sp. BL-52-GroH TaxID=3349877 RepID=UPI00384D5238